ncbi:MAG: DUF4150 domain-containing protein [Planctomycetes bacterium]|nr:DUF4150 domain-containing protein [Planctomycetota bacterium]
MFPASTMAGGQCMGMPDTCLTPAPPAPPVPVPYPNIAMCMQANPGSCTKKVKIANMSVIVVNSQIVMTSGDEAGVNGGVMSGQFKGPAKFKRGSSKVKAEGKNICFLTSTVGQNGSNPNVPAGTQIAPSQVMVLIGP